MTDKVQGQGAATAELEALKQRVADLESGKSREPVRTVTRMVELYKGSSIWVPYHGESVGERLVRNEFADIDRQEFERDEAIQAIGREVVADDTLRHSLPEPSPSLLPHAGEMIDTRTGQPVEGRTHDVQTYKHIDRIAAGFDRRDRAALKREFEE